MARRPMCSVSLAKASLAVSNSKTHIHEIVKIVWSEKGNLALFHNAIKDVLAPGSCRLGL